MQPDRQAAIAVIVQSGRFLVIERSQQVRAPGKLCFPGGEVEDGEHVAEAVIRELDEEMKLAIQPVRQIWKSVAPSGCVLHWIHARIIGECTPVPNSREVAAWFWMTPEALAKHPKTLSSNVGFIQASNSGELTLPNR
ncbi:MAG: NUDIX hydrolase [Planctomycetaceae bacterium]|nr:NUDIX hydrolase [Planctomycetaceae bacterium]MCP4464278.1 NUDIX hydrolase [Planctomycetaceae bacterium]MDG2104533.1 NUDIX hydrolase [Pirellulaceae bacterium]